MLCTARKNPQCCGLWHEPVGGYADHPRFSRKPARRNILDRHADTGDVACPLPVGDRLVEDLALGGAQLRDGSPVLVGRCYVKTRLTYMASSEDEAKIVGSFRFLPYLARYLVCVNILYCAACSRVAGGPKKVRSTRVYNHCTTPIGSKRYRLLSKHSPATA